MDGNNVTVCIKAFARPLKLKKTLESVIRAGFKNIIVGYDGPDNLKNEHEEIVRSFGENILFMCFPFNYGLAAVRNRMIENTNSEFILLLDDDQYIPMNICDALDYLAKYKEVGVLSFPWRLIDPFNLPQYYKNVAQLRAFFPYVLEIANFIWYKDILIMEKCINPEYDNYKGNIYAKYFDYVPMSGFFRHEIFDKIKFDDRFIIGGEHQDFYLTLKQNTNYKCAICLTFIIDHDLGGENNNFPYETYRFGNIMKQSDALLCSKWKIKHIREGAGLYQFFYVNRDDLSIENGVLEIKSKGIREEIKTSNYVTISDKLEKVNVKFDDRLIGHLVGNFDINEQLEGEVSGVVKTILPICDYFVDVGANVGYYTYLALKYTKPGSKIFSFEPDEQFYDYLIEKYSKRIVRQNFKVFKMSVSDKDGTEQFYLPIENGDSGSTLQISKPYNIQTVKCTKLDTVLNDIKSGEIGFIKIDTEGGEEKIIHGLSETFQRLRPILIVEFHKRILENNNISIDDLVKFIYNKNYGGAIVQVSRFLFSPSELSIRANKEINLEKIKKYYKTLKR